MTTQLSSFSILLTKSVNYIKVHFANLILLVGLGFSINLGISAVLAGLISSSVILTNAFKSPFENLPLLGAAAFVALGAIAGMIYVQSWSWVAVISYINDTLKGQTLELSEVIKSTRPLAAKYFALSLGTTSLFCLGYSLLVVPGIIFAIWFTFVGFVLVEEGLTGTNALIRSKFYVSGYTWQVFVRVFLLGLLTAVITIASGAISNVPLLGTLAYYIIQALLLVAGVVFNYHIYQELKTIKSKEKFAVDKVSKTPYRIGYILGAILLVILISAFALLTAETIKNPPVFPTPTPQVSPTAVPSITTTPTPAKTSIKR